MRRVAPLVLLLLAGCAAPPAAEPPDAAAPLPPREHAMAGCTILEALTTLPAERVRPHVPEGFEPLAGPDGVRVVLGGSTCGGRDGRAFVAIAVRPLAERLRDANVSRYYFEPEHGLVRGEPLDLVFRAARAEATPLLAVTARAGAAHALLEATHERWRHRIELVGPLVPGEAASLDGVFREYAPARDGYAYLDATFGLPQGSRLSVAPALVRTGEGTLARELLGEQATLPTIVLADAAYDGARVGFVAYP